MLPHSILSRVLDNARQHTKKRHPILMNVMVLSYGQMSSNVNTMSSISNSECVDLKTLSLLSPFLHIAVLICLFIPHSGHHFPIVGIVWGLLGLLLPATGG
ncbi:hypothetical protein NLI96_g12269 [Meripilus lineatus]|uniref:Uncharacterized protein n=1 Tax=Meripilus lineatus TaxID=2056292 RepID=A0AAD5UQ62_9APHY|nr:hypothetical protein NLI96_g12269 [Physisporinus lineatus]